MSDKVEVPDDDPEALLNEQPHPKPANYESKAAKRLVAGDAGQDHAELAALADGDDSRVKTRWFTARTYLVPLADADQLVWLRARHHDPANQSDQYYTVADGRLVLRYGDGRGPTVGVEAMASFCIDYAAEHVTLRPVWIEETPLAEVVADE